jgi:uncharacterized membrane protein YedE/YeeE
MKNNLTALLVGFIFALGLGLSGMTQPQKVMDFLNIFGTWDPTLMFVMVSAILVHAIAYKIIRRRSSPVFSVVWHVPQSQKITRSLVLGAIIFGMGWGLAGFCPGPAIVSLGALQQRAFIFVTAMLVGMYLFKQLDKKMKFKR